MVTSWPTAGILPEMICPVRVMTFPESSAEAVGMKMQGPTFPLNEPKLYTGVPGSIPVQRAPVMGEALYSGITCDTSLGY